MNYQLANDSVDTFPIMGMDAAGDMVSLPTGSTPTVVVSDTSALNAVVKGNNLSINALKPTATGVTVEVDDGSLKPYTLTVDIVADVTATSVTLDLGKVEHASQPVPVSVVTPPVVTAASTGTTTETPPASPAASGMAARPNMPLFST